MKGSDFLHSVAEEASNTSLSHWFTGPRTSPQSIGSVLRSSLAARTWQLNGPLSVNSHNLWDKSSSWNAETVPSSITKTVNKQELCILSELPEICTIFQDWKDKDFVFPNT